MTTVPSGPPRSAVARAPRKLGVLATATLLVTPFLLAAQSPQWDALRPGPHAAGFRLVETWDRGRSEYPRTDYAGRRSAEETGAPTQLGIWYPAVRPSTAPMTFFALTLAVQHRERFGPLTAADSAAARQEVTQLARMAGTDSASVAAQVAATLAQATASYRDAAPATGSFPVAVIGTGGWLGATTVLAEYLATHGWIVVATTGQTAQSGGQQVSEPALAIDVGLNAIAFAVSYAHALPGADLGRLSLIGFNFDSFSALEYQARYMAAAAVVTVNGWETIDDRAAVLRSSLWYDPTRIRVPVLNAHWDEPGSGPANLGFLEGLRYADRRSLVISGLDHFGLILNPLSLTFASPRHRIGQQYLIRAVHSTVTRAVGGAHDGFLDRLPADAGFPADLLKENWYRAGLPAVPTRAEFFAIIADQGDLATATRLFRDARSRDAAVQLFTVGDMSLAAFRYQRRNQFDEAIAVHRLTLEAYPTSHLARNSLGNTLLARADTAAAAREFEAALALLEANEAVSAPDKAEQARLWQAKLARLRPRGGG